MHKNKSYFTCHFMYHLLYWPLSFAILWIIVFMWSCQRQAPQTTPYCTLCTQLTICAPFPWPEHTRQCNLFCFPYQCLFSHDCRQAMLCIDGFGLHHILPFRHLLWLNFYKKIHCKKILADIKFKINRKKKSLCIKRKLVAICHSITLQHTSYRIFVIGFDYSRSYGIAMFIIQVTLFRYRVHICQHLVCLFITGSQVLPHTNPNITTFEFQF